MKIYNSEKSGKIISTRTTAATRGTAVLLFVLSIFALLLAQDLKAETGTGMINRTPLTREKQEPTELEKLSSDLDEIIKSINDIPDEVEDNTVTAEPEEPVEIIPTKKIKPTAPVVAKPENVIPAKVKTVKKAPEKKPAAPVLAKPEKPVLEQLKPVKLKTAQEAPPPQLPIEIIAKEAYLKLASNGEKLQNNTEIWDCVEDVKNGLIWEVKSNNDGIRDKDHLYSWFDPSQTGGITDGGRCKGDISCDTNAYVQAINKQKLCGHDDWRLPTREEMQSLVYFGSQNTDIRINSKYFPEALASWYWTASSNKENPGYAWYVLFKNGISLNDLKKRPKHIRLVRTDKKA